MSGWHGPAVISNTSNLPQGTVSLKTKLTASAMEIRAMSTRPHLHVCSLLPTWEPHVSVLDTIRHAVDNLPATVPLHLGLSMHDQQWNHANKNFSELLSDAQFFAANQLQLQNVTAVRLGRGLKDLPPAQGYTGTMVIAWSPHCSSIRIFEPNLQNALKELSIPLLQLHKE